MKKSILNLGTPISRESQQLIFGGDPTNECGYGTCSGGAVCYHGSNGTFCSSDDLGLSAIAVEPPKTIISAPPKSWGISGGGGNNGDAD